MQDVALIRCTVVDASGATVHSGTVNVTFATSAGPGYVWASHNGDPACQVGWRCGGTHIPRRSLSNSSSFLQEPSHSATKSTYHGLVRAIVRPNIRATGSSADRALEFMLNPEAGMGPDSSSIAQGSAPPASSFTVTASSPGLVSASITVPLSVNPVDSVLAVAVASVGKAYIGE